MGPWRLSPGFLGSKGRGGRGHAKALPLPPRSTGAASFSLESVPRIACSRDGNGRNQTVSWSNFEDVVNEILPFRLVERQEMEWSQRMGGRGAMFLKGDCRPFVKLFTLTAIAFSTIFIFYETRFLRGTERVVDVGVGGNRVAEGTLLPEFSIVGKQQSRLLSSLREGEGGGGGLLADKPHLGGGMQEDDGGFAGQKRRMLTGSVFEDGSGDSEEMMRPPSERAFGRRATSLLSSPGDLESINKSTGILTGWIDCAASIFRGLIGSLRRHFGPPSGSTDVLATA